MSDPATLNRAALDVLDWKLRSMVTRPGMHGDALAVECLALFCISLRRVLLGVTDVEPRSFDTYFRTVFGGLIGEWFGIVNVGASAFMKERKIGPFVAELYHRERERVPDPGGSTAPIEGRVDFDARFVELAAAWRLATGWSSNPNQRIADPNYRAIVDLGWPVVHVILRDFAENEDPDMWGPALREITGESPVPRQHAGRMKEIAKDWVQWGKERGMLPAPATQALAAPDAHQQT